MPKPITVKSKEVKTLSTPTSKPHKKLTPKAQETIRSRTTGTAIAVKRGDPVSFSDTPDLSRSIGELAEEYRVKSHAEAIQRHKYVHDQGFDAGVASERQRIASEADNTKLLRNWQWACLFAAGMVVGMVIAVVRV